MLVLTPLNMGGNEIQNVVLQVLAAAPSPAKEGQLYYNSTDKLIYQYTGSAWTPVGKAYVLPQATASVLGGIKIGAGLKSSSGLTQVDWDGIPNKPKTVDGYGIVDAVTEEPLTQAISSLGTLVRLKGVVNIYDDLPGAGSKIGDVYIVLENGKEYIWVRDTSGQEYWEPFGVAIDLTGYLKETDLKQSTGTSTTAPMSQDATAKALLAQKITTTFRSIEYDASAPDTDPGITVTVPGKILYVDVTAYNGEQVLCDVSYSTDRKTVTITAAAGSFREDRPLSVTIVHFAQ